MSNQAGGKIVAVLLGITIAGLGAGTFWMWKTSQPVLSHSETLGTEVVPVRTPVRGDSTVSMKLASFSVRDESYNGLGETSQDFVIPYSDTRYLTYDDLIGLDELQLKRARNEIYARHGRAFESQDLMTYFENQDWYWPRYLPDQFPDSILSAIEKENALFIGRYEKLMGY